MFAMPIAEPGKTGVSSSSEIGTSRMASADGHFREFSTECVEFSRKVT
jgi:hypothetical protein